jgi:hypothetical protein
MLDQRITKHDIKGIVSEPGCARIADNPFKPAPLLVACRPEIYDCHLG